MTNLTQEYLDEGFDEMSIVFSPNNRKSAHLSVAYCLVNYLAPIMSK